jgi:hypothetical protein
VDNLMNPMYFVILVAVGIIFVLMLALRKG